MAPLTSLTMSFQLNNRPLGDYEFTFESYLDDSLRIEADDVCAVPPTYLCEHRLTTTLASKPRLLMMSSMLSYNIWGHQADRHTIAVTRSRCQTA
jgi:hypothetical protein